VSYFFLIFFQIELSSIFVILLHIDLVVNLVRIDFATKFVNMCDEFAR
jgi:hypothetical protein